MPIDLLTPKDHDVPKERAEGVLEMSAWGEEAEERAREALHGLAQWAQDEARRDASKSAEELYGEKLSVLLREAPIRFGADSGR